MPVLTATPNTTLRIAKGQDVTIRLRVRSHETCKLIADAASGATSLSVQPLPYAIASGAKLIFGENYLVTTSSAADAGDVAISVTAIDGPLKTGDIGQVVRDLTGFTIEMEVLENRGDATPVITLSGADVSIATQTGVDRGIVDIALVAADTSSLEAKSLYWACWRRNSGSSRPLAEGQFELYEGGFLS